MSTSERRSGLLGRLAEGPVICAEGYLFELERRGYLQAGAVVPGGARDHPEGRAARPWPAALRLAALAPCGPGRSCPKWCLIIPRRCRSSTASSSTRGRTWSRHLPTTPTARSSGSSARRVRWSRSTAKPSNLLERARKRAVERKGGGDREG